MKGSGQAHVVDSRLRFEALEPRLALSGNGLVGQYFHNADFTGLAESRAEAVSFNWGTDNPAPGMDADSFSIRWSGQVLPEFSETYTFRVLSDEGARLWVDGRLLIDDWTPHELRLRSATIALQAGVLYDIRLDYFDGSGSARIELSWASPSRSQQIIPAERLFESPAGLLGSYADGTGGQHERVDSSIDFNWGVDAPIAFIDANGFNVNWTGQVRPDYSEEYTFSTVGDDGLRLWIGGELVIDNWTNPEVTEVLGSKVLEAGKWYDVRIEYHDESGPAEVHWRWSSARQTGGGVFEVVPQSHLRATERNALTYANPLGNGEDPFVTQWDGQYLMTRSVFFNNTWSVWINRANSLEDIHASMAGTQTVIAWSPPSGTNYSGEVWAPELHRLGNNWYIYVAASDGNNVNHRMHVLERLGSDPFGAYTYKGQLAAATDRWAIDGTVLDWQGTLYFVWSGWPGFTDGQQNIYIAEMRNPWTLRGDRVLISTPQFAWEKHGLDINEGPQILTHDGQLHIIYSASGFWTPQYALGRLTYNGVGSLLSAASWTKSPLPVFQRIPQVAGVGHASFTKSPDGNEDWMVYHSHANPNQFTHRVVNIKPFTFAADGTPVFGAPVPFAQQQPIPSAGPDPERPFVFGDYNADGLVDALDRATWLATFGLLVFPGTSADGNADGVVDAADYVLWRHAVTVQPAVVAVAAPPAHGDAEVESPAADSTAKSDPIIDKAFEGINLRGLSGNKVMNLVASPLVLRTWMFRPDSKNLTIEEGSAIWSNVHRIDSEHTTIPGRLERKTITQSETWDEIFDKSQPALLSSDEQLKRPGELAGELLGPNWLRNPLSDQAAP